MNIPMLIFILLTLTANHEVWQSEQIFVAPSAYVIESEALTWSFPFHLRYGLNNNIELLSGALWYTAKGDYWNYYGALGFKFGLWDDFEGKPFAIGAEIEAKGWGSISGRYLAGLRGALILSKNLWRNFTLHTFANYGWNNFGKSLGPLDFYLDKMKLKIVPMLGFGLRFVLSERLWLLGEGLYSQGEFYRLGEKRWEKENLFTYGVGMGYTFNFIEINQSLPEFFRLSIFERDLPSWVKCGICFAPKQAYTEYKMQTEMVEQGRVRSFRNLPWGLYKIYFGFSLLIKRSRK